VEWGGAWFKSWVDRCEWDRRTGWGQAQADPTASGMEYDGAPHLT
jgi:hypothetical protein